MADPQPVATHGNALGPDGKEGVDGSSPSEGSAKAPHVGAFVFRSTCSSSIVQWVWSRLWSFQVQKLPRAGVSAEHGELLWVLTETVVAPVGCVKSVRPANRG